MLFWVLNQARMSIQTWFEFLKDINGEWPNGLAYCCLIVSGTVKGAIFDVSDASRSSMDSPQNKTKRKKINSKIFNENSIVEWHQKNFCTTPIKHPIIFFLCSWGGTSFMILILFFKRLQIIDNTFLAVLVSETVT